MHELLNHVVIEHRSRDTNEVHRYFAERSIDTVFVLQPSLATKRFRSAQEARYYARYELRHPRYGEFFATGIAAIAAAGRSAGLPIHDLSHALDEEEDSLYFDVCGVISICRQGQLFDGDLFF